MTIIEKNRTGAPGRRTRGAEVTPVDRLADETGATTAEYAITTLAACGFAAVLVVLLKSGEVRSLLMGIITSALSMGS
ncbi:DUF4244 domain-containing protein [Brachybacterium huguangmaarense]|uniref:DUF4244 domain-containing protein n=1 Tax=Brachybacterium huguangmaarense TaxID=1652028 RepID=A0ABY6G437_9MICO|nr:DUF4244 domain-containing protein [Brachybacterium huguangmaarense]UYG17977.1 DUF4244 domain-containing protein [Brachybacterium huguangmaarense]